MINKVILIGNVGSDVEVKNIDSETKVAKFSLATSESFNKNGEKVTNTEWHRILAWKNLANVCESYIKKGMQLYIEGKIQTKAYEDSNGVKKYVTEITAYTIKMLGKKESKPDNTGINEPNNSDDLPF